MDNFTPSTFTPFLRRFTDERLRDTRELTALYDEVRTMHQRSRYSASDATVQTTLPIYAELIDRLPEPLGGPFAGTLGALTRMERTIFEFPEVKWGVSQFSLKEQIDLQRFLTAKRHFLTNQERVIDLLLGGLRRIFNDTFYELPELAGPSPFTTPFINAHPYPRECMSRLFGIVWDEAYIDNGLFVELGRVMHVNICAVSKITDLSNPKGRPLYAVRAYETELGF
jgi:hypothetical protein